MSMRLIRGSPFSFAISFTVRAVDETHDDNKKKRKKTGCIINVVMRSGEVLTRLKEGFVKTGSLRVCDVLEALGSHGAQ